MSAPVSREKDRARISPSNDAVRRSVDDGMDLNKSLTKGGRPKRESKYRDNFDKNKQNDGVPAGLLAQDGKSRQRRGWGRPIDPFNPAPPQADRESSQVGKDDPGDIETQMDSGILKDVFGGLIISFNS